MQPYLRQAHVSNLAVTISDVHMTWLQNTLELKQPTIKTLPTHRLHRVDAITWWARFGWWAIGYQPLLCMHSSYRKPAPQNKCT